VRPKEISDQIPELPTTPFDEGRKARSDGIAYTACPYWEQQNWDLADVLDWKEGWMWEDRVIKDKNI
jgi:hypothetical protein